MPAVSKTDASPKPSKPITRSSLRQSLNLASVGKAFAEAISSKDGREASKNAKKVKESRRSSVASVSSLQPGPIVVSRGASMDIGRPSSQVSSKRTGTPDSKVISTRKRTTAPSQRSASEEQPRAASATPKSAGDPAPTAASPQPLVLSAKGPTLRPRTANNATSALPKYRPRSAAADTAKPPSPTSVSASVRAGTRRRLSSSDDEKKEQTRPAGAESASPDKMSRPISPLPQRAALRANLTNVSPPTTPSTPSKTGGSLPINNASPSRPAKIVKTTPGSSSIIPRATSSSAVSLALRQGASTPKDATPKATGLRAKLALGKSGKSASITPSNIPAHLPDARNSPSPLARRKEHKVVTATPPSMSVASSSGGGYGNMSNIMEDEDDEDDDDVALLLAPVAQLGAPTPAMPRIQHPRRRIAPQTPTRRNGNLQTSDKNNKSLRPPVQTGAGSLMSFERMISSGNAKLPNDEFGRKIADTAAPFTSGIATPSMRSDASFSAPDSPTLDSPGGGYGSISQVLLPDVTPSPAVNRSLLNAGRFSVSPEVSDAGSAAFMKLQLTAAQGAERALFQQKLALEEEVHQLKQASAQAAEEHAAQMAYMERLMQEQYTQVQSYHEEQTSRATAELEKQLEELQLEREHAVDEALTQFAEDNDKEFAQQMETLKLKQEVASSRVVAAARWDSVRDACQVELDDVQDDRAMLALFMNQLDQLVSAL